MSQLAAWMQTPLARALGLALAHFVWEGAVLAMVLAAILRFFRGAPARRRYTAACLILAGMPLAFAATLAAIWVLRPVAVAAPIHWAPVPLSDGPIAIPPARFSWALILDRLAWLVPVWMAGVAFFYARGVAGWAAVQRLRYRGVCAVAPEWQARLDRLAARVRVSRPVALVESCFTDAPVLIGYLRPVILLPLGCLTGLSTAQVECLLLHELAHVARHDYLVNLLQSLVEGLLFYHPAVWWVSRAVRAERENCCDDRVVELMGDAHAYAATLAVLEQRRAFAPALGANGGNLMKRIRRLTAESHPRSSVAPAASALALLVLFAAALTALPSRLPSVRHAHAAMAIAAAGPQQAVGQSTSAPYHKWLTEDVAYIITDQERAAFLALTTDEERENFIDQFWKRRDPTPGTPENEMREEHYRRIAYANQHFAGSAAGWKTDRGRMYIVYGPPDEIDDHPPGGAGEAARPYHYQVWRYRYIEGIGTNVVVEFADRDGSGDLPMTSDPHVEDKLPTPYRKWLNEDVAYIITPDEHMAFLKLTTDEERENFIAQFWQRRGEAVKQEHYRRIAYANENFTTGVPGWKTDRGRTYIVYGPPDAISMDGVALEWTYRHIEGLGDNIVVAFNWDGSEYHMTKDPGAAKEEEMLLQWERHLKEQQDQLTANMQSALRIEQLAADREAKIQLDSEAAKVAREELAEVEAALAALEAGQEAANRASGVRADQSAPQTGKAALHILLQGKTFHIYMQVNRRAQAVKSFEDEASREFQREFQLPPGQYRVDLVVKDMDTGASHPYKFDLAVN